MFNSIEEAKGFLEQRGFKIDEKEDKGRICSRSDSSGT